MNVQLTQIVRQNTINDLELQIQRTLNYEEVILEPKDLDIAFMDSLLKTYENMHDPNIDTLIKAERYILKSSDQDADKEQFFERQYVLLQKQQKAQHLEQLFEALFAFRARMNGTYSIIFYFKSFETFEELLKAQLNVAAPLPSPTKPRMTLFSMRQSKHSGRSTPRVTNRPSNFSKIFKNVFNRRRNVSDQFQFKAEQVYTQFKVNGCELMNYSELDQFGGMEQNVILNLSKSNKRILGDDSDSSGDENIREQFQCHDNHNVVSRQEYLKYIYGDTTLYNRIITSTLPFNTILQQEDTIVSFTNMRKPLLNEMPSESVQQLSNSMQTQQPSKWNILKLKFPLKRTSISTRYKKQQFKHLNQQYNPF